MDFLYCAVYLALIGIFSSLSALLPRRWFRAERFPFRACPWEQNGAIYERLGVRRWKEHLPDMSRILPWLDKKQLTAAPTAAQTQRMIAETCVAEAVHIVLSLLTLACAWIWPRGGLWLALGYILIGHIPYIIIQRYNRPRLVRMQQLLVQREARRQNK